MSHTTIVERSSEQETCVTRVFNAPCSAVFAAWSQPDRFLRWWLPRSMGITLEAHEMDIRTGGHYRLTFPGGMAFYGRYLEVVAPERLVWSNEESGADASITTVTFEAVGETTRLVMRERYPSKEALDAAGLGAAEATHETFAQLDELLAESAA